MKRIRKIIVYIGVMSIMMPIASYASPSDYPFYQAMIANQVIEIFNMLLEMERELKRYERLLSLPIRIVSRAMQEMEDIKKINNYLIGETSRLLSSIESESIAMIQQAEDMRNYVIGETSRRRSVIESEASRTMAQKMAEVDEMLQQSRAAVMKWNIEKEKYINEQIQKQKENIQYRASVLAQSQIANEALLVLTEQIESLLTMVSESQKLLAAEKSQLYFEERHNEALVDQQVNHFFTKESTFSARSRFNSGLYPRR